MAARSPRLTLTPSSQPSLGCQIWARMLVHSGVSPAVAWARIAQGSSALRRARGVGGGWVADTGEGRGGRGRCRAASNGGRVEPARCRVTFRRLKARVGQAHEVSPSGPRGVRGHGPLRRHPNGTISSRSRRLDRPRQLLVAAERVSSSPAADARFWAIASASCMGGRPGHRPSGARRRRSPIARIAEKRGISRQTGCTRSAATRRRRGDPAGGSRRDRAVRVPGRGGAVTRRHDEGRVRHLAGALADSSRPHAAERSPRQRAGFTTRRGRAAGRTRSAPGSRPSPGGRLRQRRTDPLLFEAPERPAQAARAHRQPLRTGTSWR